MTTSAVLGLTAFWLATAFVGAVLLAAGSPGVAVVWLALALAGLWLTWVAPRGRHRRRGPQNVRPRA